MKRCNIFVPILFFINIYFVSTYKISSLREKERYHDTADRLFDRLLSGRKEDGQDHFIEESNKKQSLQDALNDLPSNGQLFEEDIIMDDRLRQNVLGVHKRTSLNSSYIKWPKGVLYYDFHKDDLAGCAQKLLDQAIKEYEKRTCITFVRKKPNDGVTDYVFYTSEENVCSSNIGRVGGKQKIYIGKDCCVLGTVLHETMHSLGFIHEQSRHDRDQYIKIRWENIKKDEKSNFNKYSMDDTTDNSVEYNLASVMHYRNDAFTNNGGDTIEVKGEPDLKFGQRIKFSVGDVEGINTFYNCPAKPGIYDSLFKIYAGKLAEKRKRDAQKKLRLSRKRTDWMGIN